jgi:hypothetical protein
MRIGRSILAFSVLLLGSQAVRADDWPQWLGPNRLGIWNEKKLGDTLTDKSVLVRWRKPIHGGYAGPAVAAGGCS